ncbi:tyrosine-type recombinase/integrase [Paenibacillus macquariensis]|nr:tyrosine-type recombinase/integrase [Paenibacillus macquariensis]MEC0089884.1 tyrosine-type recombinase/integrase [Paenibacillus macquariensis]OAB30939.1 integrase [Paenibacillus macquariensis subsp. macquariensis]
MNQIKDVQPIRSKKEIDDMKWSLKRWCSERDYILFFIGINTGLRCGDILKLKTADILRMNKRELKIKEGKTAKVRTIDFNNIYDEVKAYAQTVNSEWLFPSRKGEEPITVTQAYRQLNKSADMVGLESVGTHTMRKTFGYHYYSRTKNIAMLQTILNHSTPAITLKYIGYNDKEISDSLKDFYL